MMRRLRALLSPRGPELYAVLDIGTVEAKALLVLIEEGKVNVIGVGRQPHQPGAFTNGTPSNVPAVVKGCEYALAQAEAETETVIGETMVADRVIIGVSGPMVMSSCLALSVRRPHPTQKLTEDELRSLIRRTQRMVLQHAHHRMIEATGSNDVEVGVMDANVLHVLVDAYPMTNTVGLTGAQVEVRIANVVAPMSYLACIGSVATALELETVAILSGGCALAQTPGIAAHGDALVLDVGGECTDVIWLERGVVAAVHTLPIGGQTFSRRVSRVFGVPVVAAEEIKRTYAGGRLDRERAGELRSALAGDVQTWIDGIQALLEEMAGDGVLPGAICMCGGGAALPDLERAVRRYPWLRVLPFARAPQVTVVQPVSLWGLTDSTRHLSGVSFAVPAALSLWAARASRPATQTVPARLLQHVLHGMGLA